MTVTQAEFRRALLDPAAAVPEGLIDPAGRPAGRRFAVYRNNVAVALTEALEAAFPVLRRILGEDYFKALAGVFLRAHPPASPVLAEYGAAMPGFLERFPPLAHLGYLPDVARLEHALGHAARAADARPIGPDAVAQGTELAACRVTLAPAVSALRSRWPLHGIWRFNTGPGAPKPPAGPEEVLVSRPGFDPQVDPLPPGGTAFVAALRAGATLAGANAAAGGGFDPGPVLGLLLSRGAIAGLRMPGADPPGAG